MTLMKDDLYLSICKEAVNKAMRIRKALQAKEIPLHVDAPTNQLFPIFTDEQMETLEEDFELETWERADEKSSVVRICTSWATKEEAVARLIRAIEAL